MSMEKPGNRRSRSRSIASRGSSLAMQYSSGLDTSIEPAAYENAHQQYALLKGRRLSCAAASYLACVSICS